MSGWEDLRHLGVTCRPFDGPAPIYVGAWSRFRSNWGTTVKLFARELEALDAENIILELDIEERHLRVDGLPRADARLGHPGVRISFNSRWGPLRYETGEYHTWQDNIRAIALSMEALRKVDRYGVSKRGEQYRGWRQLTTGTDPADQVVSKEQAVAVIADAAPDWSHEDVRINPRDAVLVAIKATHPDTGGDETKFRQVLRARTLLGV